MRTLNTLSIDIEETGKRIAEIRERAGLSVKELQQILGFEAPQAIYRWQRGKCLPTLDHLVIIAAVCGVSMDDLIITK